MGHCALRNLGCGSRNHINNDLRDLFGASFLQKVSRAFDGCMWLTFGAGYPLQKDGITALGNRIIVGKRTDKGLFKVIEKLPCQPLLLE